MGVPNRSWSWHVPTVLKGPLALNLMRCLQSYGEQHHGHHPCHGARHCILCINATNCSTSQVAFGITAVHYAHSHCSCQLSSRQLQPCSALSDHCPESDLLPAAAAYRVGTHPNGASVIPVTTAAAASKGTLSLEAWLEHHPEALGRVLATSRLVGQPTGRLPYLMKVSCVFGMIMIKA